MTKQFDGVQVALGTRRFGRLAAGLVALAAIGAMLTSTASLAQEKKPFGQSFKEGVDKVFGKKEPPPEKLDGSLSLLNNNKPGVGVYVSVGRLYEQHGKYELAEQQYQLALKAKPNDLGALLSYAQLKERMNKPDEALAMYQQATREHPKEAAALNNLGMYYARRKQTQEAIVALSRAVLLQPTNALYRNNIATLLVDMNRSQEALGHLKAAHGDATAYYNLGFLLNKKGQKAEAMECFASSLRADPTFEPAQNWLAKLQDESQAAAPSMAALPAHAVQSQHAYPPPFMPQSPPPVSNGAQAQLPPVFVPRATANVPHEATLPEMRGPSLPAPSPAQPETMPIVAPPPSAPTLAPPQNAPGAGSLRLSSRPSMPTAVAPLPPGSNLPTRLPPTWPSEAGRTVPGAPMPGASSMAPVAPMPPATSPQTVQRLPIVR